MKFLSRFRFPFERRKYYGLPVQIKYAFTMTLVSGFCGLVMIFVMAWFIQRNYSLFMGDELGISAQVIEIVRQEQRLLEISLFFLFVFTIGITFVTAFYTTRKLTGPMVALHRHLQLFSRGDWSRELRLRHNDEFKDLEKVVNLVRENHIAAETTSTKKVS